MTAHDHARLTPGAAGSNVIFLTIPDCPFTRHMARQPARVIHPVVALLYFKG